jgi:hypothetical protein
LPVNETLYRAVRRWSRAKKIWTGVGVQPIDVEPQWSAEFMRSSGERDSRFSVNQEKEATY